VKEQREAAILAGLDEFDLWISDILERGVSVFLSNAPQLCRIAAQRLVDAKAPSLAASVDALPSALLAMPPAGRADASIQALGAWHLLAEACRRQNLLPEALREDVRRLTGWSMQRQALLDDKQAQRKSGSWTVFAIHSQAQPDKLRRIETWLEDGEGGHALLMDFVPLATGAGGSPFAPGERFHAELVFYPSAAPMRAIIAARSEAPASSNARHHRRAQRGPRIIQRAAAADPAPGSVGQLPRDAQPAALARRMAGEFYGRCRRPDRQGRALGRRWRSRRAA
jgi:hypothetical protein